MSNDDYVDMFLVRAVHNVLFNVNSRKGKGDLIPLLQKVQAVDGYISAQSLHQISRYLKISEDEIFGVASFYAQFRFTPPAKHSIRTCIGTACHVQNGQLIQQTLERKLGIQSGQITADARFDLQSVACLGCCGLAPNVQVDDDIYGNISPDLLDKVLDKYE